MLVSSTTPSDLSTRLRKAKKERKEKKNGQLQQNIKIYIRQCIMVNTSAIIHHIGVLQQETLPSIVRWGFLSLCFCLPAFLVDRVKQFCTLMELKSVPGLRRAIRPLVLTEN